jgi:hypothetical protein
MFKLTREPEGKPVSATESGSSGTESASIQGFAPVRDLIQSCPVDFLAALGEQLFLIGTDVKLFGDPHARADLLALDTQGCPVVVVAGAQAESSVLDRGLMCAGLVAGWKPDFFFRYGSGAHASALSDFLKVPAEQLNRKQRMILVAPGHGFAVYSAAWWLEAHCDIEIRCLVGRIDASSGEVSLSEVEPRTFVVGKPAVEDAAPVFPGLAEGPSEILTEPPVDSPVEPALPTMTGERQPTEPKALWSPVSQNDRAQWVEQRVGQILSESKSRPGEQPAGSGKAVALPAAEQIAEELVAAGKPAATARPFLRLARMASMLLLAAVLLATGLLISNSRQPARAVSQEEPQAAQEAAVLAGSVVDAVSGKPIPGARLYYAGESWTTGNGGEFHFEPKDNEDRLLVRAAGYRRAESPIDSGEPIRLEPIAVRGYYLTHGHIANPQRREAILKLIRGTSANSVVLGVKDASGHLNVAVDHPLAPKSPSGEDSAVDLAAQVSAWKTEGVYTVALVALFKDGLLAKAQPDLALRSIKSRRVIMENDAIAWTDPAASAVRDYNIAVAAAAAAAGFDEIQFDFVRYPSADLSYEGASREEYARRLETLVGFLRDASEALAPHNVYLSANVFGVVCEMPRVSVIGQKIEEFAEYVDYISPMLYPSYFEPARRYPVPLQHSYQLVYDSLRRAAERLEGDNRSLRLRPWLQNFPDRGSPGQALSADNIRSQVKGAEDANASGWMLWDARNRYENTTAAMRLLESERTKAEAARPDVSGGSLLPFGGDSNPGPPTFSIGRAEQFRLMLVLLLAGCCLGMLYAGVRVAWVLYKWSLGEKPRRWQSASHCS